MKPVSISLRGREKEAAFKANLRNGQGVNGQVVHYKTKVREAVKFLYISDFRFPELLSKCPDMSEDDDISPPLHAP